MFIVDIIILLLIILLAFLGYKKGLISVILNIFAFLLSIIIAFVLFQPVSNIILENTKIDENISSIITNQYTEEKELSEENNFIRNYMEKYINDIRNEGITFVANKVAITIVKITVFIGLFLVARVLLIFVKVLAKIVEKIPIIKQVNEIGGIIYGIIKAVIIIYLILAIILLCEAILKGATIIPLINQSIIGKFMYENNIILMIFF